MKIVWTILIVLLIVVWGAVALHLPTTTDYKTKNSLTEQMKLQTKELDQCIEATWLSNLVTAICITLDWDYSTVESLSNNEGRLEWLRDNIKKVPAHHTLLNEDVYAVLAVAYPSNEQYTNKYKYYKTVGASIRKEATHRKRERDNSNDFICITSLWYNISDCIAEWHISITNTSKHLTYYDIHFKTKYYGKSGTLIDRSWVGHTEYDTFLPGETKSIVFTEFTHSQAVSANIDINKYKL